MSGCKNCASLSERAEQNTQVMRKLLDAVILSRATLGVIDAFCPKASLNKVLHGDIDSFHLCMKRLEEAYRLADPIGAEMETYHGCFTGDCPHDKQEECNADIAKHRAELEAESRQDEQPGGNAGGLRGDAGTLVKHPAQTTAQVRKLGSNPEEHARGCSIETTEAWHWVCEIGCPVGKREIAALSTQATCVDCWANVSGHCPKCGAGATQDKCIGLDKAHVDGNCPACSTSNAVVAHCTDHWDNPHPRCPVCKEASQEGNKDGR